VHVEVERGGVSIGEAAPANDVQVEASRLDAARGSRQLPVMLEREGDEKIIQVAGDDAEELRIELLVLSDGSRHLRGVDARP
jgi:hypothetical protein